MPPYVNPLHPPVPSALHTQYTSLCNANPPLTPPFPTSFSPSYRRVPQETPTSLLSSPRRPPARVPITFELIGAPSRGTGVPMREVLVRSSGAWERMIVDSNERVGCLISSSPAIRRVSLRIMWPGYGHVDWSHPLDLCTSNGPVTRGELAWQIASAFSVYMAQMSTQMPSSSAAGWRLAGSPASGVTFERLVLTALWNICDDQWMAEVYVDCR